MQLGSEVIPGCINKAPLHDSQRALQTLSVRGRDSRVTETHTVHGSSGICLEFSGRLKTANILFVEMRSLMPALLLLSLLLVVGLAHTVMLLKHLCTNAHTRTPRHICHRCIPLISEYVIILIV